MAAECHFLVLEYAFEKLGLHRVEFGTFTENVRMRSFFEKVGIQLESIKKEYFFEDGQFKDDAVYVVFEQDWSTVKDNLRNRAQRKR